MWAKHREVSRAQVALARVIWKDAVRAPIIGVTKWHDLDDAVAAPERKLDTEEIERLERDYVPHALAGPR